ncbi:efflux RND transporter periplasmic adaptor subunit [Abyssalbus ytuae]|uniref:Efflux RND transporter periplasmic adaptor subunit n=1 Tax=Abyssalbus ytuae TaxID=2926907 RepID=A0A9E7A1C2_9FLAO|nr:efflux RND transporter periplasmic adaptor subunit [Abyssalbus ytuae]UOB17931.1 efflux RND transporter periplasmic adaptor subunit [Abyssalbus ytuae]
MKNIFFLSFLVCVSCTKKEEKILPEKTNLTESVYSSVTVQPDSLYQVYSAVSGIVDKIFVEEGDLIEKSQPLFQIVNSSPKLNTENAKLSLELAKKNYAGNAAVLKGIEDEIEAATLKFKNDSANYFRQKNLWEQNIGSKVQYDTQKLNYELSQNNLNLLKSKYDRTKNELLTSVKQAENNYKTSLINTEDFTVNSKIDGKMYAIYKNPGEIVTTVEPLASVGCSDSFIIEMLVDEVDIVKILQGQKLLVTLDAYNNKVFTGYVSKIYPKKDERNQTFTVDGVFNQTPEVLYPGLSGEANIIIKEKENILTIPKEYLIGENKVKTENGIVEIETGLENMDKIEIVSGLDEHTYIYKPKQ